MFSLLLLACKLLVCVVNIFLLLYTSHVYNDRILFTILIVNLLVSKVNELHAREVLLKNLQDSFNIITPSIKD